MLLSITVPNTARRSVFALSAPQSALFPSLNAGTHSTTQTSLPNAQELAQSLSSLNSLEELLASLKVRDSEERQVASKHFREVLHADRAAAGVVGTSGARNGLGAAASSYISDSFQAKLLAFSASDDVDSKWAVVTAVRELINAHPPEPKTAARLALALFRVIPCSDATVVTEAAQLFVQLIPLEGMGVLADTHCAQCLEWLEDARSERKRMGALIFLAELMKDTYTTRLVANQSPRALDALWAHALTDPTLEVREAGRVALEACVAALPGPIAYEHRRDLLETALSTLQSVVTASYIVHGAVLTCLVLARASDQDDGFVTAMWPLVLRVKDRDPLLAKACMDFLVIAAEKNPAIFESDWLHPSMTWICEGLQKQLSDAYFTFAKIAPLVKHQARPYMEGVIASVQQAVLLPHIHGSPSYDAIATCIGGCAVAFGPKVEAAIEEMLGPVCGRGLNSVLVDVLGLVQQNIPGLAPKVHNSLLDAIASALVGMTFQDFLSSPFVERRASFGAVQLQSNPSTPTTTRRRSSTLFEKVRGRSLSPRRGSSHLAQVQDDVRKPATQLLALETLASMEAQDSRKMLDFVHKAVLPLIQAAPSSMRTIAIKTAATVLNKIDPDLLQGGTTMPARDIIRAILRAAVADEDALNRRQAIECLHPAFDLHLADSKNVATLTFALNDPSIEVRLAIIALLGRLSARAKAHTLPPLRNELTGTLTILDDRTGSPSHDELLALLAALINAAPVLAGLYAKVVLEVLQRQLEANLSENHVALCFEVVKAIAKHAGRELKTQAMPFIRVACECLRDQSSIGKRRVAVSAIATIAEGTACMEAVAQNDDSVTSLIIAHLATETETSYKREAIRAVGMLGAARSVTVPEDLIDKLVTEFKDETEHSINMDKLESGLFKLDKAAMETSVPNYIADWILGQLLAIWERPSMGHLHFTVVETIVRIFRHAPSRKRSYHFSDRILQRLLDVVRDTSLSSESICYHVAALGTIVRAVDWRAEGKATEILAVLFEHWDSGLQPSSCIVETTACIASALRGNVESYIPVFLNRFLGALYQSSTSDQTVAAILRFLRDIATNLKNWLSSVIPAVLFGCDQYRGSLRSLSLETLTTLASANNVSSYFNRLLATLIPLCQQPNVANQAARTLCITVKECGDDALSFASNFQDNIGFRIIDHPYYQDYIEGSAVETDVLHDGMEDLEDDVPPLAPQLLVDAFEPPEEADDAQWTDWFTTLCAKTAKNSNNYHLRASAAVADLYPPLQAKLLNYATFTFWYDLPEESKAAITEHLREILASEHATAEVHDAILLIGIPLPISHRLCKAVAFRRRFLHRACRYAELEYAETGDESIITDLLRIQHQFQTREPDNALGLLELTTSPNLEWAELGRWHSNLQSYDATLSEKPDNSDAMRGVMRCLNALEEFDILLDFAETQDVRNKFGVPHAVAPLIANAAWSVGRPDAMQDSISYMRQPEKAWYAAVLATMTDDYAAASSNVEQARDLLCQELVDFGRTRTGKGLDIVLRTQLLVELEEAGKYREDPSCRPIIRERWTNRLATVQKEPGIWQRCLKVHSLAMPPQMDVTDRVKYSRICRKAGRKDLAHKMIVRCMSGLQSDPLDLSYIPDDEHPALTLERCRLAADFGEKQSARDGLRALVVRLRDRLELQDSTKRSTLSEVSTGGNEDKAFLARCLHTLGDHMRDDDNITTLSECQVCYERSTELWPSLKGFRKLASVNLAIIAALEASHSHGHAESTIPLAVSVIESYTEIIQRANHFPLQDILGILTTVFKFAQHEQAAKAAEQAFDVLPIDCWLEAVPQLTAQLNFPSAHFRPVMERLMQRLARAHPHTLLASLTAITKYPSRARAEVAGRLLDIMRLYDEGLVREAILVNDELNRAAMTWEEALLSGVERAANFIFNNENRRDAVGLINFLETMALGFENPQTQGECRFVEKYGERIQAARDLGRKYLSRGDDKLLARVWGSWHAIHRMCNTGIKQGASNIDLGEVSPQLARSRNMRLSVPGTYLRHSGGVISIMEFVPALDVLASKQRPRKLCIRGSDGKPYNFLLKPREDLRMDERCMQLFTLVNSLLSSDPDALKRHLRIVRFAVVPLSHNAGLLSWFERGDTLQTIIRTERALHNVPLDLEIKIQSAFSPATTKGSLTIMQQVELFELALEASNAQDMATILWRKSNSCLTWIERRTAYARSLATTSMVGHVLGLGDRHPSNVLQDRLTGEMVHIDFGDCFEAAMERSAYPEKQPFRLTRQLVNCLGPSKVEGSFRICSQYVMAILRENKDSIEAVFAAFLHDPLIQHIVLQPREIIEDDKSEANYHSAETNDPSHIGTPRSRFATRRRRVEGSTSEKPVTHLSPRAQKVVARAKQKLEGTEFGTPEALSVDEQVDRLIKQSTNKEAFAACYQGWCSFW